MSENEVQDNVQELATNSQSDSVSSNQDSGLLQEVMAKKERLQKAESELAELKGKMEEEKTGKILPTDCPICQESMECHKATTLECNHSYHIGCIDEWLVRGKNSCPMCS